MAYEKILYENEDKGFQLRLTLGEFRDVEYFHIRKYFLDYEGDYKPSKEGVSMPATLQNTNALLDGLLEIVSQAEGSQEILEHLSTKISDLQNAS